MIEADTVATDVPGAGAGTDLIGCILPLWLVVEEVGLSGIERGSGTFVTTAGDVGEAELLEEVPVIEVPDELAPVLLPPPAFAWPNGT